MARSISSSSGEGNATLDLIDALGSSLDIRIVLERAYPLLLELVPADYGALGISSSGRPEDYEWMVSQIPETFFAAYPDMAPHDFVRTSVASKLNVVLRDEDMIARPDLESNIMYRRAREVGAPLEQVMAVMLHVDERWQSGLSLYRERRRPFTERERASLQRITPALANAVRSCHLFSAAAEWGAALNALLAVQGASVVLLASPAAEVARTAEAARLIDAWFDPHERRAGALPEPLLQALSQAAEALGRCAPAQWSKSRADATLQVSFVPVTGMGRAKWMLVLKEIASAASVPPAWQARLTPREQEVVAAVVRGWDNRLIGSELGCTEATVKKHLQKIFDKLGVQSRTALVARAAEQRRP
ncbi:MAG: response regulator transcription factor [Polyangiaceae bacterium]|nr:response regulator transcription factor [Polyangiaceae bacterium]